MTDPATTDRTAPDAVPAGIDPDDGLAVLAYALSDRQHEALESLPSMPGRFQVGWRSGLSAVAESALIDLGLIEQHWTWASTTRPDTGITERGIAVRQILARDVRGIARATEQGAGDAGRDGEKGATDGEGA